MLFIAMTRVNSGVLATVTRVKSSHFGILTRVTTTLRYNIMIIIIINIILKYHIHFYRNPTAMYPYVIEVNLLI